MPKIGVNHPFEKGMLKEQLMLNDFTLTMVDRQHLRHELQGVDGIVLYALEGHEAIYEWIVEIRKYSTIPVWVCVPGEKVKVQTILYLHLGVDGVFEAEDIDEMVMIMKKTFVRQAPIIFDQSASKITLIPEKLSVLIDSTEVALTRLEYKLVVGLLKQPNTMMSYQTLSALVWEGEQGSRAQLANLIASLRSKLQSYDNKVVIKTIRTKGYSLVQ